MAVISRQPVEVVRRSLEDWARFCDSDGLYETRKSFEDISSSFEDGEPKEMREFFDPGLVIISAICNTSNDLIRQN